MNKTKFLLALPFISIMLLIFIIIPKVYAATTPTLGLASSFGILSSTYTNSLGGTTINGDLGYTTGPAMTPTVNGTIYSPPSSTYATAGVDQATALSALNAQSCDFIFGSATALNSLPQPLVPGVYCITGAASVSGLGITLSGSGTYIFRMTGALTTVAGSVVTVTGGASACDIFWTPTGATTLGANSTFVGTLIDDAGITIGNTVVWSGQALAFGGTVSSDADTITVPTCVAPTATPTPSPTPTPTPTIVPTAPIIEANISSDSNASTLAGIKDCSAITNVAPTILESRKISPTSIFISWGPYSGTDRFIVQYGLTNSDWLYSTNITGFSTTLNELPANKVMWIRVATRNDCSVGNYGPAMRTGGPSLPNTGVGPDDKTSLWYFFYNKSLVFFANMIPTR